MDYFRQCLSLETNPCVLCFVTSLTLEDAFIAAEFRTRTIDYFPDFSALYGLKKSMNGEYKTNVDCSFIWAMVENYCTLGKT